MEAWVFALAGALALLALSGLWFAALVHRNRGRRRALQFANAMLTNADAIKDSVAAGYPLTECLAVLDAFYKVSAQLRASDASTVESTPPPARRCTR